MKKIASLFAVGAILLFSSTGCKPDKKVEPVNPYYCIMEINGVPYSIPYEIGIASGNPGYRAGKIGTTEYQISFKRINDFVQTQLKFSFAGNTLPDEDTVLLNGIDSRASLIDHFFLGRSFSIVNGLTGKINFTHKSIDSLTGTFEFDGALYLGSGNYNMDSVIQVRKGKFCIKTSNL